MERYETCLRILSALPDHVALLDSCGEIVAVNRSWTQFSAQNHGNPFRTGVGQNYLTVCDYAADHGVPDAGELAQKLRDVLAGRRDSIEMEYPCHSSQEMRWFTVTATSLGATVEPRAVIVHRNVSIRRKLQLRLAQINERIEEILERQKLETRVSFLVHEIKNPLGVILLRSQLLHRMLGNTPQMTGIAHDSTRIIQDNVRQAVTFLDKIRELVRSEEPDEIQEIDLNEFLDDTATLFEIHSRVTGIQLSLIKPSNPVIIQGHRLRLVHIMLNVLLNSFEEADERIALKAQERGAEVCFTIVPQGRPGFPPVRRLKSPGADLFATRKMAEAEHGTLESFESPDGVREFRLTIPMVFTKEEWSVDQTG